MDNKLSGYALVTSALSPTTKIVIIQDGNKLLDVGYLALNLPNFGNKGITKNVPVTASAIAIPLTSTNVKLPANIVPYTLANGTEGQEITLIALGDVVVTPDALGYSNIEMSVGDTVTLLFVDSTIKWTVKNNFNCIIT